jgi:hypothetical protein
MRFRQEHSQIIQQIGKVRLGKVVPVLNFFLICILGGGIKVHSTLRLLNGLLCQPRVIMIMEKSVE